MTAAVYCRLSREDGLRSAGQAAESESIQNQKTLLARYAAERGWEVYAYYVDDDYSGADRDRPAFNRLVRDAGQHKFDIVLVKTQSRFTRDMECVEKYIHGKFAEWGIRFVAAVDNADTELRGNKKARQINGLVNEWYLEDLSDNIRTVLDAKRAAGQFIGSFARYGYRKDPRDKNRLLVDAEAAEVVRLIFSLCLQGSGKTRIARLLNGRGIPNPSAYKRGQGLRYHNGRETDPGGKWSAGTVGQILRDPCYTGDLVQAKNRKVSYKSKKLRRNPPSAWITVADSHPAIVSREAFAQVQRMTAARCRASPATGQVWALAGRVFCGECGSPLHRCRGGRAPDGKCRSYLRCGRHARGGGCAGCGIRLDLLEAAVLARLQAHLAALFRLDAAAAACAPQGDRPVPPEPEAARLRAEIDRSSRALEQLYLDRASGAVGEEPFAELRRAFQAQRRRCEQRLRQLADAEEKQPAAPCGSLAGRLRALAAPERLTRELAAACIASVRVYARDPATGAQPVEIRWAF